MKCFEEIINIGYAVYRIHGLPWFRSLSWYFLVTSNYFFYGENLVDYFGVVINRTVSITIKAIAYFMYLICFINVNISIFMLSVKFVKKKLFKIASKSVDYFLRKIHIVKKIFFQENAFNNVFTRAHML